MKSKITNYATLIMGLLLLAVSLYLIKTSNDPQGIMRTLWAAMKLPEKLQKKL